VYEGKVGGGASSGGEEGGGEREVKAGEGYNRVKG